MSHPSWVCGLRRYDWTERRQHRTSHPSWVCGLKHRPRRQQIPCEQSHPSWVCGLKHGLNISDSLALCHTLRGCVDWNMRLVSRTACNWVTPFVGVWIETDFGDYEDSKDTSHPSWVCGLKLLYRDLYFFNSSSHPSWVCGLKLSGVVYYVAIC